MGVLPQILGLGVRDVEGPPTSTSYTHDVLEDRTFSETKTRESDLYTSSLVMNKKVVDMGKPSTSSVRQTL